jgi:PiT family inorganic phosphate transporter
MGVGLMNAMLTTGSLRSGINWGKAEEVGLSLLVSPVVGFCCSAVLFLLIKALIHKPELYSAPDPNKAPPLWIRGILCLTCTGVSYAHGSNDGQKGIGLLMLILVGIIPGMYALDLSTKADSIHQLTVMSQSATATFQKHAAGHTTDKEAAAKTLAAYLKSDGAFSDGVYSALVVETDEIAKTLANQKSLTDIPEDQRSQLRATIYSTSEALAKLSKTHQISGAEAPALAAYKTALDKTTRFIPVWVKFAVALALGLGTMIGWKRIVVTVGEKIGKSHLTYAQGASAEMVAMITIGLADSYGLPVSTTHVLSSGVAGTMAANKSGLQMATLRNLLLAWVLTLPVCVFLGAGFFAAGLRLMARIFGLH